MLGKMDMKFGLLVKKYWLSVRKKLSGAKDNRSLFFKTIGYCFNCSFYGFLKILGRGKSRIVLSGDKLIN